MYAGFVLLCCCLLLQVTKGGKLLAYSATLLIAGLCVTSVTVARAAEDGKVDIDIAECADQQEACKYR